MNVDVAAETKDLLEVLKALGQGAENTAGAFGRFKATAEEKTEKVHIFNRSGIEQKDVDRRRAANKVARHSRRKNRR